MDTDRMVFEEEMRLVEAESDTTERESSAVVLNNIMEVLFPAAMPPAPKNARMIRRFGFH